MKNFKEIYGIKKISKSDQQKVNGGRFPIPGHLLSCKSSIQQRPGLSPVVIIYFCNANEGQACGSTFFAEGQQPTGSFCINA